MTTTIGVDPGKTGAIACLFDGQLLDAIDMPTIGKHVNAHAVAEIMREMAASNLETPTVIIEDVHSMPGNGGVTMFSFGRSKGIIEGVVATLGYPIIYVSPAKWKKAMGLQGKDKDASRQLASNTWPPVAGLFKRKKDDGRAEAALIAKWGSQ